jgi:UDP-glucose 4-epimerase
MRVLVTGGAGFIGSHVVNQLLAKGHLVEVVDDLSTGRRENLSPGVAVHVVDIRDRKPLAEVFQQFRPDAVCHQAAQMSVSRSVREPAFDAEVNLLGLIHVLDEAVRAGAKRVVSASSGGVLYGDVFAPAPETTPANPISPYGISKWGGEKYLEFYAREHRLSAAALRYSNVYGPRQNPHGEAGVVAIFCQRMLAGEPATINGDGKYIRDYVYAEDVARANVLALTHEHLGSFLALNIGTGKATDVNELEAMLRPPCIQARKALGLMDPIPSPVYRDARAGDLRSNLVDAAKAKDVLGWEPLTGVSEGLAKTVAWFAEEAKLRP